MQYFTNTKPMGLYEAAIGEKSQDYYVEKFEAFDQQGQGLKVSWNWAAFLFGGFWALYRKMYGWFVAWWLVATVAGVLQKVPNADIHLGSTVLVVIAWLGFSLFANSMYHSKIKSRIDAVTKSTSDSAKAEKRLRAKSGVNAWVPIVFGGVPVLGIVLAFALPAFQDRTNVKDSAVATESQKQRQAETEQKNQSATAVDAYRRGDYKAAADTFAILAKQGDSESQYNLGLMYASGQGVAKDEQEAVSWYRKAAGQGSALAQSNLGVMYAKGTGVPKDEQEAVVWYRKAAEQGNAISQANLGAMYEHGQGVTKDDQQAVAWYRKAAEQGEATGQNNLGLMYARGQGVAKDDQQAMVWFRKAAEQGSAPSQYSLGFIFANGKGVAKDDEQALIWYLKAAEQGEAFAQNNLGWIYANGTGTPKNNELAYFWWLLASAQGNENSVKNRDVLEKALTAEQRANAQASARNWKPK